MPKWNWNGAALVLAIWLMAFLQPVEAQTPPLNPQLPTIFVVGDSTARNNAAGAQGWGDPFIAYFDAAKVNVLNRAMAGRSSRSYIFEGRWDGVLKEMKAGDFVLLQMGHNDGGNIEDAKARASLPGLGDESREVTKADGSKETVHTYGWYLRKFIADTKAKGATPIMLSLTVRKIWKEGHIERGSGRTNGFIAQLAQEQGLEFLDLTNIVANQYESLGEAQVRPLFGPDYVHTSPAGAELNAMSVVSGLKQLPHVHLDAYFSEKGRAVPLFSATPAKAPVAAVLSTAVAPAFKLRPLPIPADPALPNLFLIGDSTVRNGGGDGGNGQWGWGEPLAGYFDAAKINLVNRAVGGLSSRTYLTSGYWDATRAMIKPGDFVMMQFGHNDSGAVNDATRARASIRGIGQESQAIDNLLTKKPEIVRTYGWYLRQFIADIKAKGAIPIVCSPIPRQSFSQGKTNRSKATYAGWAGDVAKEQGVAFIDLNEIIARQYDVLGPEKVGPLFADANTHTSLAGAEINAASVIAGLKTLRFSPLSAYFSIRAANVTAALPTEAISAVTAP